MHAVPTGDKINFGGQSGATVKRMGYFRTVLQTKDKTLLIVPNGDHRHGPSLQYHRPGIFPTLLSTHD